MASSFGYSLNFIRYFLTLCEESINPFSANFRPKQEEWEKLAFLPLKSNICIYSWYYQPTIFYLCKMVGIRKKYKEYGHFLQINDSRSTIGPNFHSYAL
jgi:hypothetical protein